MIFLSLKKIKIMFPKVLKIILAVLSFSYGIYQIIDDYIGNGVMLITLGGMFILLYFKNELIFLAFLRLRKQDFEGTEKWLIRIPNIDRNLVKKQQGYILGNENTFNYNHWWPIGVGCRSLSIREYGRPEG